MPSRGPLAGLRVVEMAGIGPIPFCGMVLSDLGADVLRIDRPGGGIPPSLTTDARFDVTGRGRRTLTLNLREPGAIDDVLTLVKRADALIEGFRPGVMERMGLGPDVCLSARPELVYGRMTGWGQHGPLAHAAGHDINYIAISGALGAIGRTSEPPVPPLNYIGDYAGGAMLLVVGVLAALHERKASGRGQVVDAAMTDGAALLSAMFYGWKASGIWSNDRGANFIDGGAHFYDTYACADGKYVAIGAIEPKFYEELLRRCGIDDPDFAKQNDKHAWPLLKRRIAEIFRTRTRDEWTEILQGTDACFAPVLDWDEAPMHPHNVARESFVTLDGVVQPAPAPRFSRTSTATPELPGATIGFDAALAAWT
jgi:alpha-methylacyl-CoA racemase